MAQRRQSTVTDLALVAVFAGVISAATLAPAIPVGAVGVPITLQTLAVALTAMILGPWRGFAATALYVIVGLAGLPVFAGGASGIGVLAKPSAGYLLAFPFAAALTGWLAQQGWNGSRVGLAFASMLAGNVLCLVIGVAWLAVLIGLPKAIMLGAVPFILGAILSVLLLAGLWTRVSPKALAAFDGR